MSSAGGSGGGGIDDVIERHRRRLEEQRMSLHSAGTPEGDPSAPLASSTGPKTHSQVPNRSPARGTKVWPGVDKTTTAITSHHNSSSVLLSSSPGAATLYREARDRYFTTDPERMYERSMRWASNRDRFVQRAAEERKHHETDGCTFHPSTSRTRSEIHFDAIVASEAPSMQQHIQRQECARREREELARRSRVDTSTWSPRTTVPKEFVLGRRTDRPISALRKPVVAAVHQHSPSDAHHHDSASSRPARVSSPDQQVSPSRTQSHRTPQDVIHELKVKVDEQQREIASLNGTVHSLRRELEVAKAKVRQLAVSSTTL